MMEYFLKGWTKQISYANLSESTEIFVCLQKVSMLKEGFIQQENESILRHKLVWHMGSRLKRVK
jgi:hypothetical protein